MARGLSMRGRWQSPEKLSTPSIWTQLDARRILFFSYKLNLNFVPDLEAVNDNERKIVFLDDMRYKQSLYKTNTKQIKTGEPGEKDEGDVHLLDEYFESKNVVQSRRAALIVAFNFLAGDRISGKPKWGQKGLPESLRNLTAPQFLKTVHADVIVENHVYKEMIREYDPQLMKTVESYISKREARGADWGDAAGLVLVASKPPTNKVRREPERVPPKRQAGLAQRRP